jgi:hypothetical protein
MYIASTGAMAWVVIKNWIIPEASTVFVGWTLDLCESDRGIYV